MSLHLHPVCHPGLSRGAFLNMSPWPVPLCFPQHVTLACRAVLSPIFTHRLSTQLCTLASTSSSLCLSLPVTSPNTADRAPSTARVPAPEITDTCNNHGEVLVFGMTSIPWQIYIGSSIGTHNIILMSPYLRPHCDVGPMKAARRLQSYCQVTIVAYRTHLTSRH